MMVYIHAYVHLVMPHNVQHGQNVANTLVQLCSEYLEKKIKKKSKKNSTLQFKQGVCLFSVLKI